MREYCEGALEAFCYVKRMMEKDKDLDALERDIDRAINLLLSGAGSDFEAQLHSGSG